MTRPETGQDIATFPHEGSRHESVRRFAANVSGP
jgi:hypothetical protein